MSGGSLLRLCEDAPVVHRPVVILLLIAVLAASACGRPPGLSRAGREPLIAPAPPAPTSSVVIEVFGTPGLRFGGSYGELGAPQTVIGVIPSKYTFHTRSGFSVSLQKRGDGGELGILVTVDGRILHRSTTKKESGLVTFVYQISSK